jgi:hypothetical protein
MSNLRRKVFFYQDIRTFTDFFKKIPLVFEFSSCIQKTN